MKTKMFNRVSLGFLLGLLLSLNSFAQSIYSDPQYFRYNDKRGLNVFETSKEDTTVFDGVKVRVGGDFALQFQGLSSENDNDNLVELVNNFTLPTANLNLDVQLADGLRMHLRTYLSSRHHIETYVKGGYLQIDNLNFIGDGFLSGVMDVATIRFGMDQINYGDTHFRRSDNAQVIYNPFVGNYIMDSFTTEPFGEITIKSNGILAVAGITNGRLNQSPLKGDDGSAFYLKGGYDKQFSDDLRFRITASYYRSNSHGTRDYIYGGDRAGARYFEVFNEQGAASQSDFEPRFNPNFAYQRAIQINPFLKFSGFEFFGVLEFVNNGNDDNGGKYTQTGIEALYRFGSHEQLYVGGRINGVSGEQADGAETRKINRTNFGFGWFLTENVLMKGEYVTQKYEGDGWVGVSGDKFVGAKMDGFVIEAAISF